MKIIAAVFVALTPLLACADDAVRLLPAKARELQLPYGETKTIGFVCPWDAAKKPTVLEFNGRIDTPPQEASGGGPVALLKIEWNGQAVAAETRDGKPRLLNKPLTSTRDPVVGSDVVWYTEPNWALMYCGSWSPPANHYTPHEGSPVRFVLDVSDLVRASATNELTLTYAKIMVDEKTLAEYCRETNAGDATVVLDEIVVRPRKDTDSFHPPSKP